jgi:hypothetical protein
LSEGYEPQTVDTRTLSLIARKKTAAWRSPLVSHSAEFQETAGQRPAAEIRARRRIFQ